MQPHASSCTTASRRAAASGTMADGFYWYFTPYEDPLADVDRQVTTV